MSSSPTPEGPVPATWRARSYPQLLRGPRYAWWRGLLAVALVAAAFVMAQLVAAAVILTYYLRSDDRPGPTAGANETTAFIMSNPWMFLVNNLVLAAMIPASVLSIWVCFGWRPRWVSSVRPGLRWGLLLLSAVVAAVGYALYAGVGIALFGMPELSGGEHVGVLLGIILVTTPLQAAGEEYLFRGALTQAIGSWFARPVVAVVMSALSTALLFAVLHSVGGPQNFWLFFSRFAIGLINSYLTWSTGGLEAAIGLHTINNWFGMVPAALSGDLGEQLANPPQAAAFSLMQVGLGAAIAVGIVLVSRRLKVRRLHDPTLQPADANRFGGQDFVR